MGTDQSNPISATSTEGAYSLSITGNAQFIFIAYIYNKFMNPPPYTGVPSAKVLRIPKSDIVGGNIDYVRIDDVVSGIGQVVANSTEFYLPYLNAQRNDEPWIFFGDAVSSTVTYASKADLMINTESTQIMDGMSWDGLYLYVSNKLNDGFVDLYEYQIVAGNSTPTIPALNSHLNIIPGILSDNLSMAVSSTTTNNNLFLVGKDSYNKNIFYNRCDMTALSCFITPISLPSTPTQIYDVLGIQAKASLVNNEMLVGIITKEALPGSPTNVYILKVQDSTVKMSTKINQQPSTNNTKMVGNGDFCISEVVPKFTIGTAGAIPNENSKNTLWVRYHDNVSQRNVIVDEEDEKFGYPPPVNPGTDLWTSPWFSAP
jgi:hypothetical protein